MNTLEFVNQLIISAYKKSKDNKTTEMSFQEFLSIVINDDMKYITESTRKLLGDPIKYKSQKNDFFPAVIFSLHLKEGSPRKRDEMQIQQSTNVMYIDIDHVGTDNSIFETLKNDPYIFFIKRSVSGNGFSCLINYEVVNATDTNNYDQLDYDYKAVFKKAQDHFLSEYNIEIDKSCNNINRLNFINYDNEYYLADEHQIFRVEHREVNKENAKKKAKPNKKRTKPSIKKSSNKGLTKEIDFLNRKLSFANSSNYKGKTDEWFNQHDNWIKFCYALIKYLKKDYKLIDHYFHAFSSINASKYDKQTTSDQLEQCCDAFENSRAPNIMQIFKNDLNYFMGKNNSYYEEDLDDSDEDFGIKIKD